jgi:hypothetical protein
MEKQQVFAESRGLNTYRVMSFIAFFSRFVLPLLNCKFKVFDGSEDGKEES